VCSRIPFCRIGNVEDEDFDFATNIEEVDYIHRGMAEDLISLREKLRGQFDTFFIDADFAEPKKRRRNKKKRRRKKTT
jgi:hypothetical protein